MASSGNFSTTAYSGFSLKFTWSETSQSIANNTTTISWKVVGVGSGGYMKTRNIKVAIDGETVYYQGEGTASNYIELYDGTVVASGSYTFKHGDDGSKKFTASVEAGIYVWAVNCTGSETFTLDTIPRASTLTSAGNVTLGNKCSVKWTPKATSFYYKLVFKLGEKTKTITGIAPKTTSAYTYTGYTIPVSWASEIPNAKTGTVTVTLTTHTASSCTDANQVGAADSVTFTVTVPDSDATWPTVTMALSPVSSLADTFYGLYIQGKTKVQAEISATGKYEASIKSYSMKAEGVTYDAGDDYTSDYLANAGEITVYGYAKDSRGMTGSTSKKITVIAYSKPKILDVVAARCDAEGNLSDSGTYLKIQAKRSYSKVVSVGLQHNYCKIRYRYKLESADSYSAWTTLLAGDALDSDEVITGALLGGVLAVDSSYLVQVQAIDDIGGSNSTTVPIPTDKVYMHRDKIKRALAFGKYIEEENCIDIAEDITVKIRGPFEATYVSTAAESEGNTFDYLHLGAKITATAEKTVSLNNYKTPGNYYSQNADNSQYITDSPYTEGGFGLIVREIQTTSYIRQELFYGRTTWIRHWDGTDWSDWWRYLTTTVAETAAADYVVETGVSGGWTYKKWKGGSYEMFGTFEVTPPASTLRESLYRTDNMTITVPFTIESATVTGTAVGYYWITNGGISGTDKITLRLMSDREFDTATAIEVRLAVVGKYA